MNKFTLLLALTVWAMVVLGDYVPGQPGGPWSQDELLIVKAKLWRLLSNKQASIWSNEAATVYTQVHAV